MKTLIKLRSSFLVLAFVFASLSLCAEESKTPSYDDLFKEEILLVDSEKDDFTPGTLRSALIRASGLRTQNPFSLPVIRFEENVSRIVLDNPLPSIDESLITLDCSRKDSKKVVIDASQISNIQHSFTINGNSNKISFCHLIGFSEAGLKISGNHNEITNNIIGYLAGSFTEEKFSFIEAKTNSGVGIVLDGFASDNIIQKNEIIGNLNGGILLTQNAGTNNFISENMFGENRGAVISNLNSFKNATPQINNVTQSGEYFIVQGRVSPNSKTELYIVGKNDAHISQRIVDDIKSSNGTFIYRTKSKGFILGKTKIVALSHGNQKNSSEFSKPFLIPQAQVKVVEKPNDIPVNSEEKTLLKKEPEPKETEFHDEKILEDEEETKIKESSENKEEKDSYENETEEAEEIEKEPSKIIRPKMMDRLKRDLSIQLQNKGTPSQNPDEGIDFPL